MGECGVFKAKVLVEDEPCGQGGEESPQACSCAAIQQTPGVIG